MLPHHMNGLGYSFYNMCQQSTMLSQSESCRVLVLLHVACSDGVGAAVVLTVPSLSCYHSDRMSRDDFIGTGFIRMSEISVPGEDGKALFASSCDMHVTYVVM